ncbi:MAG TPA: hypothetical protein VFR34_08230 [Paracoccaceae bacterium]|nr:hypothetical protein [Paracoccaceae bacterium]
MATAARSRQAPRPSVRERLENHPLTVLFGTAAIVAAAAFGFGIKAGQFETQIELAQGRAGQAVLMGELQSAQEENRRLRTRSGIFDGSCDQPTCDELHIATQLLAKLDREMLEANPFFVGLYDGRIFAAREGYRALSPGSADRLLTDPAFGLRSAPAASPTDDAAEHLWLIGEAEPAPGARIGEGTVFVVLSRRPRQTEPPATAAEPAQPADAIWNELLRNLDERRQALASLAGPLKVMRVDRSGPHLYARLRARITAPPGEAGRPNQALFYHEILFVIRGRDGQLYSLRCGFVPEEPEHVATPAWAALLDWWKTLRIAV